MARLPFTGPDSVPSPGTISVPDAYQRIQADPSAFGGGSGQALQQFGRSLEQAGGTAMDIAAQEQRLFNGTAVSEAVNQLQQHIRTVQFGSDNDPNSTGYRATQGRAALEQYPAATQAIEDYRAKTAAGLTNPAQQQEFARQSRALTNAALNTMGQHRMQQSQVWAADTQRATVGNSLRDAELNYQDERAFTAHLGDAVNSQAAADRLAGASPEVMEANRAKVVSDANQARILRVAADNPLAANAMLQGLLQRQPAALMPTAQTALLNHLRPLVDKQGGEADADAETGQYHGVAAARAGGSGSAPPGDPSQPRGIRNNNPLNLEYRSGQQGVTGSDGRFGQYGTMEDGVSAAVNQLRLYQTRDGLTTPRAMIAKWAPASENNVGAYVASVARSTGLDPDAPIDMRNPEQAAKLVRGMARVENGRDIDPVVALRGAQNAGRSSGAGTGAGGAPGGTAAPTADQPAAPQPPRSLEQMLAGLEQRIAGRSPEWQDAARARVTSYFQQQEARTHGMRTDLVRRAGNTNAALADGNDVPLLDEGNIRTAFAGHPEQGELMVRAQREAQAQGQVMKRIMFASPDEVQRTLADLDTGTGPVSTMNRLRTGRTLGVGPNGQPVDPNTDPEDYRVRRQEIQATQAALARRASLIKDDPAGFALQNPALRQAVAPLSDPNALPPARADAVRALLAEQQRLGVADEDQRALTKAQLASDVRAFTTTDPSRGSVGQLLEQRAAQYGDAWPEVFGSYVRGGLPPEYHAVAIMDRPDQMEGAAQLQRALMMVKEQGGLEHLQKAAGREATKTIDDGLNARMEDFLASVRDSRGGLQLYSDMRTSVRTLALYKVAMGTASDTALLAAYQDVLGKKYDFDGTMRVPIGRLGDARRATLAAVNALQPGDLPALYSSTPGLTDDDKRAKLLASIRSNGQWVPTADDGGLELMLRSHSNQPIRVTRADGTPVVVRFRDMPRGLPDPWGGQTDPAMGLGPLP